MKNVLIIGSTGQIGSELTMKLRKLYNGNIVAGYIPGAEPKGELKESGPSAIVDITNEQKIAETVTKYIKSPAEKMYSKHSFPPDYFTELLYFRINFIFFQKSGFSIFYFK